MPISHKKKIIFIHIPKCAGSSLLENFYSKNKLGMHNFGCDNVFIKLLYFKYELTNDIIHKLSFLDYYNSIDKQHLIAHLPLNLYVKKGFITKKQLSKYYSFTIIRNPYNRFLSMYKFLYHALNLSPKNFALYVENIFYTKDFRYQFFQPQYKFICDNKDENKIIVDKIIRFENLDKEYIKIIEKYKLNQLNHLNKSDNIITFDDFYSDKFIKKIVYKLYKKDFEIFNYKKID